MVDSSSKHTASGLSYLDRCYSEYREVLSRSVCMQENEVLLYYSLIGVSPREYEFLRLLYSFLRRGQCKNEACKLFRRYPEYFWFQDKMFKNTCKLRPALVKLTDFYRQGGLVGLKCFRNTFSKFVHVNEEGKFQSWLYITVFLKMHLKQVGFFNLGEFMDSTGFKKDGLKRGRLLSKATKASYFQWGCNYIFGEKPVIFYLEMESHLKCERDSKIKARLGSRQQWRTKIPSMVPLLTTYHSMDPDFDEVLPLHGS
ncbi:hypothetical protein JTE90_010147 [Oedothorax gibbosus]|uniref:Maturase K n=1 Tax=Oedothorax gibbosus TaxID=931172 RepID=A0AAV6UK54_9ARAC|nr:hypothetical protein JTE90_010147 [Oedothorax gibbosus]